MGMTTSLYGCIQEYGLRMREEEFHAKIYHHNEKIIKQLPLHDEWPPLTRNMFAITDNVEGTRNNYQYYGRAIHFGAIFKSIESEWAEWRAKFEALLCQLYWLEAHVHFKPEYAGVQNFSWRIDLKKWGLKEETGLHPIKPEFWDYKETQNWDDIT